MALCNECQSDDCFRFCVLCRKYLCNEHLCDHLYIATSVQDINTHGDSDSGSPDSNGPAESFVNELQHRSPSGWWSNESIIMDMPSSKLEETFQRYKSLVINIEIELRRRKDHATHHSNYRTNRNPRRMVQEPGRAINKDGKKERTRIKKINKILSGIPKERAVQLLMFLEKEVNKK
jgi:hypothetical protein